MTKAEAKPSHSDLYLLERLADTWEYLLGRVRQRSEPEDSSWDSAMATVWTEIFKVSGVSREGAAWFGQALARDQDNQSGPASVIRLLRLLIEQEKAACPRLN